MVASANPASIAADDYLGVGLDFGGSRLRRIIVVQCDHVPTKITDLLEKDSFYEQLYSRTGQNTATGPVEVRLTGYEYPSSEFKRCLLNISDKDF